VNLAQVNLARPLAPLDSPQLAPFMAALVGVNDRADAAPGFVWRLQTEEGDATALRVFDGAMMVNMSVWSSLDALRAFVYRDAAHLAIMRRRREFFAKIDLVTALWWVPDDHLPDLAEAEERYEHLGTHGPTQHAFTFGTRFAPEPPLCPA
jgi:hypothetical protein